MLTVSYIINFAFYRFLFLTQHIKVIGFDNTNCIVVCASSYLLSRITVYRLAVLGGYQFSVSLIRTRGFDFSSFFDVVFSLDEVFELNCEHAFVV